MGAMPLVNETNRQTYIRLLHRFTVLDRTKSPVENEAILAGELAEADLLDGTANRGADGDIKGALINGITVKGRLFLQALEDEDSKDPEQHNHPNHQSPSVQGAGGR